ncbi:Nucleolar protein 10 [Thelohanellus kitauei]|uniref:Nucleolar protein 10 n=1 Tax=Thelohanellus kitauei TaxID=669202 RepID=A0A0C2ISH0_THEKT|nr:Nucleolar protein 10 [Thelohanellus kitauei]
MALLLNDRYVEMHSQEGMYHRLRIPNFGRDLAYDHYTCDLNITSASYEVYRLNLESGRFNRPYSLENRYELIATSHGTSIAINHDYHFLLVGTQDGHVIAFDPRTRNHITGVNLGHFSHDVSNAAVSAIKFRDGINVGVGFANGIVSMYDVRSPIPLVSKDHMYGEPIKRIAFLSCVDGGDYVASCDSHSLKIYNRRDVKMLTTIETNDPINDFCIFPNSGLVFFANDSPHSGIYFVPSIGMAPKWCSYLDNLTDGMEEVSNTQIYDDYKFITRPELEELGLSNLIGTESLRAYMHGFFINVRFYKRIKAAHDPLSYQEFKKRTLRQKIEEERADRLKLIKLPSVNRELAEHLLKSKSTMTNSDIINPLGDDRFKKLFLDSNFEIDKDNEHFKLISRAGAIKKTKLIKNKPVTQEEQPHSFVESDDDDSIEKLTSDDGELQEYQISSIFNDSGPFSTKSGGLTIEEKLAKKGNISRDGGQELVFGDQEVNFIPHDEKKGLDFKKYQRLKDHIVDKKKLQKNYTKRLPMRTKKLLRSGLKKLKKSKT